MATDESARVTQPQRSSGAGGAVTTQPAEAPQPSTESQQQQQQIQEQQQQQQQQPPQSPPGERAPEQAEAANNNNNTNNISINSPPLPQRHTAQTPGPRASRFQDVLESSLSHTLARLGGWDSFAACFPTVAARAPGTLRAVQRQMVERLGMLCQGENNSLKMLTHPRELQKEFESIKQARSVVAKLNELESLVSDAERRRDEAGVGAEPPIPPHLLPADTVLAAHLAPHLAQQRSRLNARLQTTQAHNARLAAEVRRQRAEMESLAALLEAALRDVDAANQAMDGVAADLAAETRAIEVDLMAEP
ncbi:Nnf1-domain-containing protein [Xylariaceae sp. FL0804]|nr:Nnf1-domain-containing protein [Xylariaceae sp. FL0804]